MERKKKQGEGTWMEIKPLNFPYTVVFILEPK